MEALLGRGEGKDRCMPLVRRRQAFDAGTASVLFPSIQHFTYDMA